MGRIIFTVVLLVVLTVLIVLNLEPKTSINLFGARFQNVPVVAVAMLSFALGVVYSLFLYVGQYLHRSSRDRLAKRHQDVEERERKLAAAQAGAEEGTGQAGQMPSADSAESAPQGGEQKQPESKRARFFRFFR